MVQKFFDSGDYAMAKAKGGKLPVAGAAAKPQDVQTVPKPANPMLNVVVGEASGGREGASGGQCSAIVADEDEDDVLTGCEIPRPETVPQRKSSIIYPSAASKLSPQPLHLHHDSLLADDNN